MRRSLITLLPTVCLAYTAIVPSVLADETDETTDQKCIISIEKIWDRPDHSAFTDVVLFNDALYCTFREGSGHVPGLNGTVRVLRSRDRMNWESVALLSEPHVDLRDPKISITPDHRLMINMGASYYHGPKRLKIESRVAFSDSSGLNFGAPQKVILPPEMITGFDWMWRVTWHKGVAWACVQQVSKDRDARRLRLVQSKDGIHYDEVAEIPVAGPSETTLRFLPDGTMVAMIRSESKPAIGRIGVAQAPYTSWKVTDSNKRFGGPNFVQLPNGSWLAGSRLYDEKTSKTALWWLDVDTAQCSPLLVFPSGGDTSYPGFAIDEQHGVVYVSYYSSHEGKTSIYLATLRLDALEQKAH